MRHAAAQFAHDILAPGQHRYRVTIGHRLGKSTDIRVHIVKLLHPSTGHAKAGFDFVDHHQHAVAIAQRSRRAQVIGLGRDAQAISHDRLDQQTCDRAGVLFQHILQPVRVVGLHEMRQAA